MLVYDVLLGTQSRGTKRRGEQLVLFCMFLRVHLKRNVGYADVVEPIRLYEKLPRFGRWAVDVLEGLGCGE